MKNLIQDGKSIDYVLAAITAPGDVVLINDLVGVAQNGGVIGDTVNVRFTGVYALPKAAGAGTGIAQGTKVYWNPAVPAITATAGSLKVAGYVWKTAIDADTTVAVRLLG